ncbi:MAG: lytic transglycosylase domain-containing protein, partial [Methylohalobius sp.]|nr:lytic transglycosylase domain-containing protein [Methylohalobius sp.]
ARRQRQMCIRDSPSPSPIDPAPLPKRSRLTLVAGVFPKPEELDPQVAFWRKVYAKWGEDKVVIHDNRYLNLIYQVVRLPEPVGDGYYTPEQKAFIDRRLEYWRERLRNLEAKLAKNETLSPWEEKLARYVAQRVGEKAVFGAAERVRSQRGLRERFRKGLEISQRYEPLFRGIFRQYGLPEELAYLPHVESSFQLAARSHAGAVGMWQFTPGAAKTFIGDDSVEARLNPVLSAHGAARYLKAAYERLGSWPLAITSYNHGIGGMKRAREQHGDDFVKILREYDHPLFGFASRNYYAEFLAACEIASQPQRFFPDLDFRLADAIEPAPVQLAALEKPVVKAHPQPAVSAKPIKTVKRPEIKAKPALRRSRN